MKDFVKKAKPFDFVHGHPKQESDNHNALPNECKQVQVFVHIPGLAVLCEVVCIHAPVECLECLTECLKYEQHRIATFYTAKFIKLKCDKSFYNQGLKDESNIFVRFSEGLLGGSANYNPNDHLFPDDYQSEDGTQYPQYYQQRAEFQQTQQFPGVYSPLAYSQTQNPGIVNQQWNQEQYYQSYSNLNQQRFLQPQFYQPRLGYDYRGGGNIRNQTWRQGSHSYPRTGRPVHRLPRSPTIGPITQLSPAEQHTEVNTPPSTAQLNTDLPIEQRIPFNIQSSTAQVTTDLSKRNILQKIPDSSPVNLTTTIDENKQLRPKPIDADVEKIGSQLTSLNVNKESRQSDELDKASSESHDNSKIVNTNKTEDVSIEIKEINKVIGYGTASIGKSNINVKKVTKDNTSKLTAEPNSPTPINDVTSSEGIYDHLTAISKQKVFSSGVGSRDSSVIPKSPKKFDSSLDFQHQSVEPLRSSTSKVFNSGFASRVIGDVYHDSFSSASFMSSSSETTTSLTGKPVIQASDKESSVTDSMVFEFKPLTTGDFMLTLKCRNFQEIPSEILKDQRCKHCTKINISSNRLKEIPKYLDVDHFPSMKILDASKNKLVDLPANIAEFRGMENLDISHNQFRIFPEVVSDLKYLKILKVNNNSIEYIPKGLGSYKELEILRLEGNKLARIPEDIAYLESLQYLNISDNRLDEFPVVICRLMKLQFFYMSSNKIKEIPHNLYLDESLEVVQVDKNPIIKPPPYVLARPIQEIRRYCKEIVAGRFKDDRIVMLILGASDSGKSTVSSALCSDVTQKAGKPTEGIEERVAIIRDINVTLREFSGDTHYQGLAEMFVVQNALYFVTVNLENYKRYGDDAVWFDSEVLFYLKKVVEKGTVFLIGTHADLVPNHDRLLDSLLKKAHIALKNENKTLYLVTGFVNNSVDSFDLLKDEVTRCLLNREIFSDRGQYRPVKWKDAEPALTTYRKVNQALNTQQKTALWIPIKTVNEVLSQHDFSDTEEIKSFLRYLKCIGSILWHERLHLLKTFICANPAMLIKAIKIILSKDHKEAFMKAYKPRWRLNPVPEDDVTYVIAWQMYSTRGCINVESIRRILKAVVEDKEDINMIMTALSHFEVCHEVSICTPDIKVLVIQEGPDAGVTHQEEQWPQLATEVLLPNSPYEDDLPHILLNTVAKSLGKEWLELAISLGFKKAEINTVSAQFPGKVEEAILHLLMTWKQSRTREGERDVKKELMEKLVTIGQLDLKTSVMEFDHHAILAHQLTIELPTWKKLKNETIYHFPAFLRNYETQMSNYWQVLLRKLQNNCTYEHSLGTDHGKTSEEMFLKCYQIVVKSTLSHQIWKYGILAEGVDKEEIGILYFFQFTDNKMVVSTASNEVIPEYCKRKVQGIYDEITKI